MSEKISLPLVAVQMMREDRDHLIRLIALTDALIGAARNTGNDYRQELPHLPEPQQSLAAERIHMLQEIMQHTEDFILSISTAQRKDGN